MTTIQIVKIINYDTIRLAYINFIKLHLTVVSNKVKALNIVIKTASILVMEAMREIGDSKARAKLGWLPVTWSRFFAKGNLAKH